MSLFGRKKKQFIVDLQADPERYRGVHVMQDDIDVASGKKDISMEPVPSAVGLASDSPFLPASSGTVPEKKPERREPEIGHVLKEMIPHKKSAIVFDDDSLKESESDDNQEETPFSRVDIPSVPERGMIASPGMFPASGFGTGRDVPAKPSEPTPIPEKSPADLPIRDTPLSMPTSEPPIASPVSEPSESEARKKAKSQEKAAEKESSFGKLRKPKTEPKKEGLGKVTEHREGKTERSRKFPILPVTASVFLFLAGIGTLYVYVTGWENVFGGFGPGGETADQTPAPVEEPTEEPVVPVEEEPVQEGPFSQKNPNYLIIDTESDMATPEGIELMLSSVEADVASMGATTPIEFLVRDSNNNPVAFSRFAYMLGLKFSPDMLAGFDEDFSLYLIADGDRVRRGVSIAIRDRETMSTMLASGEEASLPAAFESLLHGDSPVVWSGKPDFRDGSYGTLPTRFVNFGSNDSLSFDYVILNDALVIGTSKDSFRAILGKTLQSE